MSSSQKIILTLILIFCSLSLSLPLLRSGLNYPYGIGFWGPMGHDGIWHLSLSGQINNPLSIDIPSFSGQKLQNYHPFYNILIAILTKSGIPTNYWIFQIAPLAFSLVFLILSFRIGFYLTKKFWGGIFLVFLNTFSNSFGWLVNLLRHRSLEGESLFYSMQPPSTQINPPLALSLVFFYLLIFNLLQNPKKFSHFQSIIIIICLSLLPVTKAYGGLAAFLLFGLYTISKTIHKNYQSLKLLLISLTLALALYLPYNHSSSSLIEYQPLMLLTSMIDSPDRLYLPKISSFVHNVSLQNKYDLRLLLVNIFLILVFLVGNFSWRIFGFLNKKLPIFKVSAIILGLIPVFFIQKATPWNIVQFFYYSIFIANILLLNFIFSLLSKKSAIFIIVFTSLVANIPTYQNYFGNPAPASLPPAELEALTFLSRQPRGTVLTYPYDPESKKNYSQTPIPLYAYETTAYVSAFSRQPVFLEDTMNLNNSNYPWQSRLQATNQFFRQLSAIEDRGFLLNNQIDYIYLTTNQLAKINFDFSQTSIVPIFSNSQAIIYQVKK